MNIEKNTFWKLKGLTTLQNYVFLSSKHKFRTLETDHKDFLVCCHFWTFIIFSRRVFVVQIFTRIL